MKHNELKVLETLRTGWKSNSIDTVTSVVSVSESKNKPEPLVYVK